MKPRRAARDHDSTTRTGEEDSTAACPPVRRAAQRTRGRAALASAGRTRGLATSLRLGDAWVMRMDSSSNIPYTVVAVPAAGRSAASPARQKSRPWTMALRLARVGLRPGTHGGSPFTQDVAVENVVEQAQVREDGQGGENARDHQVALLAGRQELSQLAQ